MVKIYLIFLTGHKIKKTLKVTKNKINEKNNNLKLDLKN